MNHHLRKTRAIFLAPMSKGLTFLQLCTAAAFAILAWIASGISLLDDDWGHLKLASKGFAFALTTGWEGLIGQGGYYRPVVVSSFYLDYLIGGYAPAIYHIHNILIHAGCAYLVFLFARCLSTDRAVAWGAALLFFLLPIHTDSIFWIVGRTDLLCTLFYLSALILFFKYMQRDSTSALLGLAVCSTLAFLSKEMAVSLPIALAALVAYRKAWNTAPARCGLAVVCIVLLAYFGVRWLVLGSVLGGTPRVSIIDWARDSVKAVAKFGMSDIWWLGIALVIGSAGIFIYQHGRNILNKNAGFCRPFALLLIFLLGASLAPALGHLHNWYLYLPSAFFCLGISMIWLNKKQPILCSLFAVLILYYGVVIGREGFLWREASQMSENAIANLMPHAQATTGTLFVCNVPSAWTPPSAFSGKPLFAYALKNALAMRSSQPLQAKIAMVNHVWLTDDFAYRIHRTNTGFDLAIAKGGFFSFHSKGQGQTPPFEIVQMWGRVAVHATDSLSIALNMQPEDRVVIYNKGEFEKLWP